MKIFIICPLIGKTSVEVGVFCKNGFKQLGLEAATCNYIDTRISSRISFLRSVDIWLARIILLMKIQRFSPDLVLIIKGNVFPPQTIQHIQQKCNVPVANYWIDDPFRLSVSQKISPFYDYFFTNDPDCISAHTRAGCLHAHWLTFGADPDTHKKVVLGEDEKDRFRCDICFSGTVSPKRAEVLKYLTSFDLKIWSPYHIHQMEDNYIEKRIPITQDSVLYNKTTGRTVWGEELAKAYNAAKIVVNIHDPQTCPIMRDFEVPGCGAFLLTDPARKLDEIFELNKEIVVFNNYEELLRKVEYYLAHEEERKQIAERGYKKVISSHLYKNRMQELISFIQ